MDNYLNQETGEELASEIAAAGEVPLEDCYQCGKCSGGCPMAASMDIMPRQLVHYMQLGQMEDVLRSRSIWLCVSCHTCVERCPHNIDIPFLMERCRQEAAKRGMCAVPEVRKFNTIFLENVKVFGKSQEAVLEGVYNTTTGRLMQDMGHVPHMLTQELVRPEVNTVKDRKAVRELMRKAEEENRK